MTDDREPADHDRWRVDHPARGPRAARARSSPWSRRARLTAVGDVDCAACLVCDTDDLLGWTAVELAVVPVCELVHPDDRERLELAADAVERAGPPGTRARVAPFTPLLVRVLARDRRYWWTRWHAQRDADGSVGATGVEYIGADASDGPPVGTWSWDVEADVVSWSTELLDMFGLALGPPGSYRTFLAAVIDDDREEVDRAVRRARDTDEGFVITFRCVSADGPDCWIHATGRRAPAGDHRRVGGLVKHLNPQSTTSPARANIGSG